MCKTRKLRRNENMEVEYTSGGGGDIGLICEPERRPRQRGPEPLVSSHIATLGGAVASSLESRAAD